jgi:hypothetical protein
MKSKGHIANNLNKLVHAALCCACLHKAYTALQAMADHTHLEHPH